MARQPPPAAPAPDLNDSAPSVSINQLILAFWDHVQEHYRRPDGSHTTEPDNYRHSLKPLRQLYGDTPATQFSPLKLKAVRRQMIEADLSRGCINQRVGRIVRMFKWAVAEEIVPEAVYSALAAVPGLQKGRSAARESDPIGPVVTEHVEAVLPFVLPPVRAMIELQRLTGMRSTDVCLMRGRDIDMSADVWLYRPHHYKTAHTGKGYVICLGPRAQEILRPWLRENPEEYLFSPREAMAAFRAAQRAARTSKVQPSQVNRARRRPRKFFGERYNYHSYGKAVRIACERAGVPHWHPHQLRHTRGTEVRRCYGLDGTQAVLGHEHAKTSEIYAEKNLGLAKKIAAEMG